MDANTEQSLELLATTDIKNFLAKFFDGEELERDAAGSRNFAATLEAITNKHSSRKDYSVDGISIKRVVRDGGGEGEGESVYRVYAIVKDSTDIGYFSTTGYYASEYGTSWDNEFHIVYPRQVVVTEYHTTKET